MNPNPACPDCGNVMHRHPMDGQSTLRWRCRECQWTWSLYEMFAEEERTADAIKAAKGRGYEETIP